MNGSYSKSYKTGDDLLRLALDVQEVNRRVSRLTLTMALTDGKDEISEVLQECDMSLASRDLVVAVFNNPLTAEHVGYNYNGKKFCLMHKDTLVDTLKDPLEFINISHMMDLINQECARAEKEYSVVASAADISQSYKDFLDNLWGFGFPD